MNNEDKNFIGPKQPITAGSISAIPDSEPDTNLQAVMQDSLGLGGINVATVDLDEIKNDSELIIISKDNGKFGLCAEKIRFVKVGKKGEIILKKISDNDDEREKELLAEFIVSMNEKQIKKSVTKMVKEALMRKPINTLKRLSKETKKKEKSELHTRRGCVWFQIGEEAVNL